MNKTKDIRNTIALIGVLMFLAGVAYLVIFHAIPIFITLLPQFITDLYHMSGTGWAIMSIIIGLLIATSMCPDNRP